uniref:Mitochondrial glycoprotein n=1 Tax=Kalanchoe fedtschenkoi TaxID=63787 RepID=A0A7N0U6L7_KALFE
MVRARQALRSGCDLLKILRSEISQEVAADRFNVQSLSGSIDQFAIEHDSGDSQDVVLRRKSDSGEEVVVSALLSREVVSSDEDSNVLPREALMKVCVRKPGLSSILQFNCGVFHHLNGPEMYLSDVFLLPSAATVGSVYKGPDYETLDTELQKRLLGFLKERGIDEGFSSWLLHYLHRKEQGQYVNWLQKIESFVAPASEGE